MQAPSDNTDTHEKFLDYTADRMETSDVAQRFIDLKNRIESIFKRCEDPSALEVLDVGCSIGIQARLWAQNGYNVTAVDYDEGLIEIGVGRSEATGIKVNYKVGSADNLPFEAQSFDICLAIELLEHVDDWEKCLDEFCRVLKPGGLLVVTTSNVICPRQNEYRLPLYSWWPGIIKKPIPELVRTKFPALANHSPCPALHWFSIFQLRRELSRRGTTVYDRVDMIDMESKSAPVAALIKLARKFDVVRFGFYLFYTGTIAYAFEGQRE